jgi:hypothetical protein
MLVPSGVRTDPGWNRTPKIVAPPLGSPDEVAVGPPGEFALGWKILHRHHERVVAADLERVRQVGEDPLSFVIDEQISARDGMPGDEIRPDRSTGVAPADRRLDRVDVRQRLAARTQIPTRGQREPRAARTACRR